MNRHKRNEVFTLSSLLSLKSTFFWKGETDLLIPFLPDEGDVFHTNFLMPAEYK